jgi:hypothetical protein
MLALLVASAKHWQLKQAHLFNQPTCLVSIPACQPSCLVSLPALSAFLPCQPSCLVILPALSAFLPYQPSCLVCACCNKLYSLYFSWISMAVPLGKQTALKL